MQDKIRSVKAREILDSRGDPTLEVEIFTESASGLASVPSGKSRGKHECVELRDGDPKRFNGKGVLKAVSNVNTVIAKEIIGMSALDFKKIDQKVIKLDGTKDKSKLGSNATLGVSIACARAGANSYDIPLFKLLKKRKSYRLPMPMMNIINGGQHAGNKLSIQEFLIIPHGARHFSEALRIGSEVYHSLKAYLLNKFGKYAVNVGDEGGFAPPMQKTEDAMNCLTAVLKQTGYESEVWLGLDFASSSFYSQKEDKYSIDGLKLNREKMIDYIISLQARYNLKTLEDPLHEDDFEGFALLKEELKDRAIIVGDDLLCTNEVRIKEAIAIKSVDCAIIKPNQIGTILETIEAINACMEGKLSYIISHRSGETEDNFISHLAVAFESVMIKSGAPARGERLSKYNELIRIEEFLGNNCSYGL